MSTKLFDGISVTFCRFEKEHAHTHVADENVIEIDYCHDGRIGWDMGDGNRIFMGKGDFWIHTLRECADSRVSLPGDHYEGLCVTLDLSVLGSNPPSVFDGTEADFSVLKTRFCVGGDSSCFSGNERTNALFSAFYAEKDNLSAAELRISALNLMLYLLRAEPSKLSRPAEYESAQVEIIHSVHAYLLEHICERTTIEQLSRLFAMNPTTLKSLFKAVYGDSIASHTKAHRMEAAARLLTNTSLSLNEVASAIGYESQSRFSAAFRETYGKLPSEYRKQEV